ncbi:alpha-amylase family glycosyl hydrolase [Flagellimonas halotolerans]|uniref:Alpha-amylase n=1 Tax=Flagellimonas halotolerans TaxID=3112164 RepID=A0ABU6IUG5_9FLAO|nr:MULTISPECIES: alpha-amylase family glycosyl hydrolase [unclassified Allomuricauda]MEC3966922.1 alpha-amylase family glycosyl hydrolase [Muricauda sp. SYSU M86414]MEC4266759.1 alpha-amylase family glycosyl hydrolase [Muricauda sp. SYSU M84420]
MKKLLVVLSVLPLFIGCKQVEKKQQETHVVEKVAPKKKVPFVWEGANIYFLLTDRFNNGNPENDVNFDRTEETGVLRGFEGGDIEGITQKIEEGYFTDLGINAIWFTPVVEQIHGATDEGTGKTYGYHGYWTKDWTSIDPNFGTRKDLEKLVKTAHSKGIRILLDVVLNHTGPVTEKDPVWPDDWVRNGPKCEFTTYENTTACTLVENLPDILTESDEAVELPDALLAKWKDEGRLSKELDELQLFFERTGYPRTPKYYIIKWLTDYINDLGVDGFRVDTVKHVNENAWADLYKEANYAFESWKKKHQHKILDDNPFYMVGEVYNYGISGGREFDFGDKKVDFFDYGFKSLINFELKNDADKSYEAIFKKYSKLLQTKLKDRSVLNYLTSHDDGAPYDKERTKPYRTANVLLLTPGASQVYYGDETARNLIIDGTEGDAALRSFMNWEDLDSLPETQKIHKHWQKLGQFRANHPAIGAGKHKRLAKSPYVFSRTYVNGKYRDKVVVGLDLPKGKKSLWVKGFFGDGTTLYDTYSETEVTVANGKVLLDNDYDIALLELVE